MASMPIYNVQVPYVGVIEHGFPPGKLVKVQGTVLPSAYRFAINLQCGPNAAVGDDIALHFNPRFDDNCIVRNSLQSMNWQREEDHGPMPFARGQGFEILILCDPNHYKIAVNGQHFAEYNHRLPFQRVSHISIEGDVTVAAIIYEGGPNPSGGLGHPPVAPGFAPPTQPHMPGGPSMPHPGGGNVYPSVPMAGAPSAMSYPTQPPAAYPTQPSGYGPPQPQPHGQGQPMYGQGYQQQPPYPGYGQPLPGQPLPGQYSKKAMKEQHKQQKKQAKLSKKALKYGLPIAGVGVGAYALHKVHKHKGFHGHHGHHGHSSSSSSSSSEEE